MSENNFEIKGWLLENLEELALKTRRKKFEDVPTLVQAEICKNILILKQIINKL
jgi:hypothetical protein